MSHAVEPADLARTAQPYGNTAFLLYAKAGSARVNHVVVDVAPDAGRVTITGFGRGVAPLVDEGAQLSLLWPAPDGTEFSLIADGTGAIDGDILTLEVTGAVLHRPAPVDGQRAC